MSLLMMLSCERPNTGHVTVKTEFPGRVPYANVLSASYTVLNYYSFCPLHTCYSHTAVFVS